MRQATKTILTASVLSLGAAVLVLVCLVFQQATSVRELLLEQTNTQARRSVELQQSLAALAQKADAIEAAFSRELEASRSSTQGSLRRLQRGFNADLSAVRGNMAKMAGALDRPSANGASVQAARPGADTRAALQVIASASADPAELDLALENALQRVPDLFARRQFAEAVRILSPLASSADVPEVRLYLASARFYANPSDSRIHAAVEQDLRVVLQSQPGNLVALEALGTLCMEQGRWDEALDCFSRVIVFKPADADVREKAGACAQAVGDLEQARAHFDKAAALHPSDAQLWFAAGCACASLAQHDEALARLQKCLELDPRHRGARQQAARCLAQLGRSAEASAMADEAPGPIRQ